MKLSQVFALIWLVAMVWLTGVLWSLSGRLVTSATDLGPIAGVLIVALTLIIWGAVVVTLVREGIRYYRQHTKNS